MYSVFKTPRRRPHRYVPLSVAFQIHFPRCRLTHDYLGVPHRVMEDNIHEGYLIPKGSLVIPNIWSVVPPYLECL